MTDELMSELERRKLNYQVIPHRRTETAGDEAVAVGAELQDVAKTLVLTTEAGYVRVVLPASERLDLHKVRELLDDTHTRLATESELALAYPMFELGAVPPFGGPAGDRVIVDSRLADRESIVLEAGTHSESLSMTTSDLLDLTSAEVADIVGD